MIEAIVGSEGAERVLLFLAARGEGYAREIALCWGMDVSTVQNHLRRLERDGLLQSALEGRVRLYRFNSRHAFAAELNALLHKALVLLPGHTRALLTRSRRRPRRAAKPL